MRIEICILVSIHDFIMKNQSAFWAQIFGNLTQHPPQTFTTNRKIVALSWGLRNHVSKISEISIILKFIIFRIFQNFYHIAFYHICQKEETFIIYTLSYWNMNKSDVLSYFFNFWNMIKNRQIWIKKRPMPQRWECALGSYI